MGKRPPRRGDLALPLRYAGGMSLPPLFDRLRLPAIGAPLFIVSNPDLVIAQCKAGIVGSFPAKRAAAEPARRMAAPDHRGPGRLGPRPSRHAVGALCGQSDRPP